MSRSPIDELAERMGIAAEYTGADGSPVLTSDATRRSLLAGLGIALGDDDVAARLREMQDLRPPRLAYGGTPGFVPPWLKERPAWGITCQLYELSSARGWGIGDFEDLALLAEIAAGSGADFLGVTPLHALLLAAPERCSPFSPSNRRFLNPLYIAVDRVPGYAPELAPDADLEVLRDGGLVDYRRVAEIKLAALRELWRRWLKDASDDMAARFEAFRRDAGEALRRHALFEAVSARMVGAGYGAGWMSWPDEFQTADGPAVAAFAGDHAQEVTFHAWLQWLADEQLREAQRRAVGAGMRIGLYLDLAVGDLPDGSAVWSDRQLYVADATIGAPPDYFSASGQEWGVVAMSPLALRARNHAPLIETLEAAARHAGALRIDHVMALWQLFLIPDGAQPAEGAYMRYDVEDILTRLADLSRQRELLVVGEDLGYVPQCFRHIMYLAGILFYRIVYFEKDHDGHFLGPEAYPPPAIACLSTHDLPTLRGWWQGDDIDLRRKFGLIGEAAADEQRQARQSERRQFIEMARATGAHIPDEVASAAGLPHELVVALHDFLARTASYLAGVRLADLVGEALPTNLPGTSDAYPNWRRRQTVSLEHLARHPLFREVSRRMSLRRPRA